MSCALFRRLHDVVSAFRGARPLWAIVARRDTSDSPKGGREVALGGEADLERHIADGPMLGGQQYLGRLDSSPDHELPWSDAGALLEEAREMVRAHVDQRAQLRETQVSGQIRLHVFLDTAKLRARHATGDRRPGSPPCGRENPAAQRRSCRASLWPHATRAGTPLRDEDRGPWLERIARALVDDAASPGGVVIACSALRRVYRDRIRAGAPDVRFVFLDGPADLIRARMAGRTGHYMPPTLLASQLQTLEPPGDDEPDVLRVDIARPAEAVIASAVAWATGTGESRPATGGQ